MKSERLKAMGVQPWYARLVLKGAGSSPSFEFEQDQSLAEALPASSGDSLPGVTASLDKKALSDGISAASSLIPKPSAELTDEPVNPSAANMRPQLAKPVASDALSEGVEEVEQIALPSEQSLMLFSSDLFTVVCGKCSSEQASSLGSLASAIGSAFYRQTSQLATSGSFVWPVFDSRSLESKNLGLHQKSFSRFLKKQKVARFRFVMLLGLDIEVNDFLTLLGPEAAQCEVVSSSVSPSDCLRDPAKKAVLWEELLDARRGD